MIRGPTSVVAMTSISPLERRMQFGQPPKSTVSIISDPHCIDCGFDLAKTMHIIWPTARGQPRGSRRRPAARRDGQSMKLWRCSLGGLSDEYSLREDDRHLAGLAFVHGLVGFARLLKRESVCASDVRVHVPAGHPLHQVLDVAEVGNPGAVDGLLVVDHVRAWVEFDGAALAHESDPAPATRPAGGELAAGGDTGAI